MTKRLVIVLLSTAAFAAGGRTILRQRPLTTSGAVDDHVIVGRARCGRDLWLLTDAPALVRIQIDGRRIAATPIRGLGRDDRPFGLACLRDDLWTLAGFRALARLSQDAVVTSRVALRQPALSVFGVGSWLLLLHPPIAAGAPLLAKISPADANRSTPWPGVVSLPRAIAPNSLASALVACGLAFGDRLPCWIATDTRISIGDGVASHTTALQPQFLSSIATDAAAPIRDVALTSATDGWILTSAASGPGGRRVAGRLTRTNARGEDAGHADLTPRARVILSANERSAVVLTSTGTLLEVTP